MAEVLEYMRQLPGLAAEEALRTADAVALGSGTMRRGQAAALRSRWRRLVAQLEQPAARGAPLRPLTEIGIRVVRGARRESR